jgi:ubiquinone/menaquinone biosynthesis C-methylase UbiE
VELREAIDLIRPQEGYGNTAQVWADLGAGSGMFTRALAELLPPQSTVHAMDRDGSALARIPDVHGAVSIQKRVGDFVTDPLQKELNGILLANALHYVRDQPAFIARAAACLKADGCFLIVEYDTDAANPWVPYPLSFAALKGLFGRAGFASIVRLHERPSIYRRAMMYSALIRRSIG